MAQNPVGVQEPVLNLAIQQPQVNPVPVGLEDDNDIEPMDEVADLDLNLPPPLFPVEAQPEQPEHIIFEPNEFIADDEVAPPVQGEDQGPEVDVVLPQFFGPPIDFGVDEVMPDQLLDQFEDLEDLAPHDNNIIISSVLVNHDFHVDPGMECLMGRKLSSGPVSDLQSLFPSSPVDDVDRLWKQFLEPSLSSNTNEVFHVPEERFKFFIFMICSPSSFAWASEFIKSKVSMLLATSNRSRPLLLPSACPLEEDITCIQSANDNLHAITSEEITRTPSSSTSESAPRILASSRKKLLL